MSHFPLLRLNQELRLEREREGERERVRERERGREGGREGGFVKSRVYMTDYDLDSNPCGFTRTEPKACKHMQSASNPHPKVGLANPDRNPTRSVTRHPDLD